MTHLVGTNSLRDSFINDVKLSKYTSHFRLISLKIFNYVEKNHIRTSP